MSALARRMVDQVGAETKVESTTDLRTALDGADYVTVSIRVGQSRSHVEIPLEHGIDQAVGDTSGPGGVFYFLRNAPAVVEIARTMDQVCPEALMLNYTNPMVMLSWTVNVLSNIRYVGLCHSYERDIVKWEIMKHFGAFVSESSVHNSEYMPYFRRTPELVDKYTSSRMWGVRKGMSREERRADFERRRAEREAENRRLAFGNEEIPIERSHEYFSRILNAIETNEPYVFNGNVYNTGLITNLPPGSVVEVPILTDGCGLHPCYVGDLPPALAALNRSNLCVQELAVKGFVEQDRECIYRAVQLDPLTASKLTLPKIREMVNEMFEADKEYVAF
jgi:alpha-galactosidase